MPEPTQTVRDFVSDSYQIISANSPTVPLKGNDQEKAIALLNRLLNQYSANGLMITVSKQVDFVLNIGQGEITFGASDFVPTPDIITEGRLVNLLNAWVTLQNVTYPLIYEPRTDFFASYKFSTLQGLPRYIIIKPEVNLTRVQVFPAPSQTYTLSVYAKFQPATLDANMDMSELPTYFYLFLQLALAKYLAVYKGRSAAWTPDLEQEYLTLKKDMEATSSQNLDIDINRESWLNGKWRVIAGI